MPDHLLASLLGSLFYSDVIIKLGISSAFYVEGATPIIIRRLI